MSERTEKVIISNEARVLRQMRLAKGLSMRAAGHIIGISDSYISQVENGRMDVPKGQRLEDMLRVYSPSKLASIRERVRNFQIKRTARDELMELLPKISEKEISILLVMAKSLLTL